jgi:hypothetical protein
MSGYYNRYRSGECEAVWSELEGMGAEVRRPPLLSEATSVADELVERSLRNICKLVDRLGNLGYAFQRPDDVFVEASDVDRSFLDSFESDSGMLPLVMRRWYERIRSVDLSQDQAQLFSHLGGPCTPVSGLGLNATLVIYSIPDSLQLRKDLSDRDAADGDDPGAYDRFLPLGGWASNCDPKGITLPCETLDAVLFNDGGGDVTFVDELRYTFRAGGFPFWQLLLKSKRRAWPVRCVPHFGDILPVLLEGLEPI